MTTVRSRGLGAEVRTLRKGADLKLEELADRCGWSRATFGRIEAGDKIPTPTEIAIILGTLGVKGKERSRLLELADSADQSHWWEVGYSGLPAQLVALLDFERTATKITDVSLALVPGLLQTADYARAVMETGRLDQAVMESRVALRLGRQSVLTKKDPVQYHAILDEAVGCRPVGGAAVMAEQLTTIVRLARRDNVTVQVLPFAAGEHVGMVGNQMFLEFRRQRPIVHLEHRRSGVFVDDPHEVSQFLDFVPSLVTKAMSPDESVEFIAERAKAWEGERGSNH